VMVRRLDQPSIPTSTALIARRPSSDPSLAVVHVGMIGGHVAGQSTPIPDARLVDSKD
jgi:hypothetical protein